MMEVDWVHTFVDLGLMFFAALKFLVFAPAIAFTHSFWIGFMENCIAGMVGVSVFYRLSDYFMNRAQEKRQKKIENGTAKPKKKFTRFNKFLVWIKQKLGMAGLAAITPTLISIPLGSIVMAKFYKDSKWAYASLLISVFLWALLIGGLASLFPDLFSKIFPNAGK